MKGGAISAASMRPRRIRRGELRPTRIISGRNTCFNAATANSPWRTDAPQSTKGSGFGLQCGHGEFAVENGENARLTLLVADRFNAATANSPWRTLCPKCGEKNKLLRFNRLYPN